MIRSFSVMVASLIAAASAFGQAENPATSGAPAATEQPQPAPTFTVSLVLIEADWSKSPSAKEIKAELRNVLSEEPVAADRLKALPSSGASILFPPESASLYTREHYAALWAWLRLNKLLLEIEPFSIGQFEAVTKSGGLQAERRPYQANTLEKNLDFLGLTLPAPASDQPFMTRKLALNWSIEHRTPGGSQTRLTFRRTLRSAEKPRGEEQYIDRELHDQCNFVREPLKSGEVLIAQAFPADGDRVFRVAAAQKGFLALIVVEGDAPGTARAADARLVLPDKVERLTVTKSKRADNDLMIDQNKSQDSPRNMISQNVMISWSEAGDTAWGFSKPLGKWAEQKVDPPAADHRGLVVADDLVVWQVGSVYYGFGSKTGRWDVLRLPDGHTPPPRFDNDFALVHDGDDDYTFANATGRWSSPKSSDSTAASKPDEPVIKVFSLRNANAADAERLVSQLFPRDIQSVAADQRTNSLIVRGSEEILNIIFHILTRLDEPSEPGQAVPAARDTRQQAAVSASVEKLTAQYHSEERKATELARQIRDLQVAPDEHKLAIDELKTKLRRAVANALAARQQLQQAEAAQLQQRLAGIQKNLEARQKLSERIIVNRVKDLLDPEIQWEWGSDGSPRLVEQTSRLSSPPHLPSPSWPNSFKNTPLTTASPNLTAARAYRNKLRERWSQVQQLFLGGRASLSEAMQAANELAQAELDASANPGERQAARRQAVDRLNAIKTIVDDKVAQSVEPTQSKLAVDAMLIKAQAELNSEPADEAKLESVPVNWMSRGIESIIWDLLHVKVQAVTPQSVSKHGYKGGLLVGDQGLRLEPHQLRTGDVILGLHHWETLSEPQLAWALLQPVSKKVAVMRPSTRTTTETADIRVLRDDKVEFLQVTLPPWPKGDAAMQPSPSSRWPASNRSDPNVPPAAQPVLPSVSIAAGGDSPTIRSADDFRRSLTNLQRSIQARKIEDLSRFGGNTDEERAAVRQKIVENSERELAFLREEYAAQLRLLELDLQDAESALAFAKQQRDAVQQEYKAGHAKRENLIAPERVIHESQTRLQRAKTLLELYRKADPATHTEDKVDDAAPDKPT